MAILILNGSPKADRSEGNTNRFIKYFTKQLKSNYKVYCIYREDPKELAQRMAAYDQIIMVMPLYIHAMPSGVKALIEELDYFKECQGKKKKIGFIVQYGFPEGYHGKWLSDYFECLARRLNCEYLGTVVKGDCAFIEGQQEKYETLLQKITALGKSFDETGYFDEKLMAEISMPYLFEGKVRLIIKGVCKLGLVDREWKKQLKMNHALSHAKDQPFLRKC